MADLFNNLFETSIHSLLDLQSDPRTADWPLVNSPGKLALLILGYIYFSTTVGPNLMKDRKPYDLKNVIFVYNIGQVVLSLFLVVQGARGGWFSGYSYTCQPIDWSMNPQALIMANAVWWYFFAKLTELLDTVFFVLRKKNNQISFLHVYHHALMPFCAWIGTRYLPGGHGTLLGFINSFIHIVMYSYYLVAALGPQYQKYLWWKKHLTALQMVQFCMIFIHNFQLFFRPCDYPKFIVFLLTTQAIVFLYMFGSFYRKSYIKNRQLAAKTNGVIQNGHPKTN